MAGIITTISAGNGCEYSAYVLWIPHRGDCPRCGQRLPDADEPPVVLSDDDLAWNMEMRNWMHGCGEVVVPAFSWSSPALSIEFDEDLAAAEAEEAFRGMTVDGALQLLKQTAAVDHLGRSVDRARAAGATWEQIGDVLGVSRQAAHAPLHRAVRISGAGRRAIGWAVVLECHVERG